MTTGGEGNQGFCKVEFSDVSRDNFTSVSEDAQGARGVRQPRHPDW